MNHTWRNMKILTVKIPDGIASDIETVARKKGLSKSEVVRRAIQEDLSRDIQGTNGNFLKLAEDLAGSIDGPEDLSINQDYMNQYGQ